MEPPVALSGSVITWLAPLHSAAQQAVKATIAQVLLLITSHADILPICFQETGEDGLQLKPRAAICRALLHSAASAGCEIHQCTGQTIP